MQGDATNEELCAAWRRDGNPRVRDKLMRLNLSLIRKISSKYHHPEHFDDLLQEGCLGFMHAIDKWDPERKIKLSTYAVWWVRAYQRRYLIRMHRIVTFGTTAAQRKLYAHPAARAKLEASGLGATPENIARMLGLDLKRDHVAEDLARLAAHDTSVDADAWNRLHLQTESSAENDLGEAEVLQLFRDEVRAYRQQLRPRDRDVFDSRFVCEEPQTLEQISERYDISRERVRQLEKRTVERLRARVMAKVG